MNKSPFALITERIEDFIVRSSKGCAEAAETDTGFNQLALELFQLQFNELAPYRQFCEGRGRLPNSVEAWSQIPALPVSAFKQTAITSLTAEERLHVFHSSGTTAEIRSRHYHDRVSLSLYEKSLLAGFRFPHRTDLRWEFLFLTPSPHAAPHSSLVHMFNTLRGSVGSRGSEFFGKLDSLGSWEVRVEDLLRGLKRCIRDGTPVALMGTAFNFVHVLDGLAAGNQRLELPAGSFVLETGGYKARSRALPRPELHRLISDCLAVPQSHIISEYGMCELSSQAYDTPSVQSGVFRFPPWARARIVSPENGQPCVPGEAGILQVFDLANVRSVLAIQTEDVAVAKAGGFELLGRAVQSEPRGCSLMSA